MATNSFYVDFFIGCGSSSVDEVKNESSKLTSIEVLKK